MLKTKRIRVGKENRTNPHHSKFVAQSLNATTGGQLRDLVRWLFSLPVVITLIFASAHLGLLIHYHFIFHQPEVDLAAKYEPWSYMLIYAVRPEIVKEIQQDRDNASKSVFQDPETVKIGWAGGGSTEVSKSITQTRTPISIAEEASPIPKNSVTPSTFTSTPGQRAITPTTTTISTTTTPTMVASPTPTDSMTFTPTVTSSSTQPITSTPINTPSPTFTPTTSPTSTSTPAPTHTATATPASAYAEVSNYGVYASGGTLYSSQGSISVWLNFEPGHTRSDHMVVHTNDSRWVLYIDTFYSSGLGRDILSIAARAGGNKSATSSSNGHSGYPEARFLVDNDGSLQAIGYGQSSSWIGVGSFPEGEWHHFVMTWDGYPSGIVKLYVDGLLTSYLPYGSIYDDGQPLFEMFSFGFKPVPWPSIGSLPEYGDVGTGRLSSGGIQAADLRIYSSALSSNQIMQITSSGISG